MSPLAIEMADDGFTEGMQTLTYELHFFSMYARAPAVSPCISMYLHVCTCTCREHAPTHTKPPPRCDAWHAA